jgi:hypothetical protein
MSRSSDIALDPITRLFRRAALHRDGAAGLALVETYYETN